MTDSLLMDAQEHKDTPPNEANYRPAEDAGVQCANCEHFNYTGVIDQDEGLVPVGTCEHWGADVVGDYVSDAFVERNNDVDEGWDFSDESRIFSEIHLAGTDTREDEGFILKEIIRTGEWPVIPTGAGLQKKPLRIVRDGVSDHSTGTVSLSELVENFHANAVPAVQIPLSDDQQDHKNLTRLNTGFVRDVWIVDEGDVSKLVARMEFTEPEIKEKVLRGTYADVSCGIPWGFSSRGKKWNAALEHVALTNRPFIDGLGPFLAASDQVVADSAEITHFGQAETEEPEVEVQPEVTLSYGDQRSLIENALNPLQLSGLKYEVNDIRGNTAIIRSTSSDTNSWQTWTVPFDVITTSGETSITLSSISDWTVDEEGENEPVVENDNPRSEVEIDPLEAAQRLRELRLSGQTRHTTKEEVMPLTREELATLELSDDARAKLSEVLDENASLRAVSRERDADRRVEELKELGLSERPGALKLYRQVMLSDDGGPAIVLLSDDGTEKESKSALEILDGFIEAIKGSDEKVHLSDQALVSENDNKPPVDAENEIDRPLEERLAEAREAIGHVK